MHQIPNFVSRFVLQLSLPNPLKPGVKLRMNMQVCLISEVWQYCLHLWLSGISDHPFNQMSSFKMVNDIPRNPEAFYVLMPQRLFPIHLNIRCCTYLLSHHGKTIHQINTAKFALTQDPYTHNAIFLWDDEPIRVKEIHGLLSQHSLFNSLRPKHNGTHFTN